MPGRAQHPRKKRIDAGTLLQGAVAALQRGAYAQAFTAEDLSSRPNERQMEFLQGINTFLIRYAVGGNQSGKTATPIRELTWLVEDCHPFFQRPPEWGPAGSPLLCIVAGQDRTQMDINFWQTRIKPLLVADEWREHRSSGSLMSVSHKTKGHQIIFLSHNNASDTDIAHMQSYSAHWVWCDEMPKSIRVLEELQRRTDAKRGRFSCTFTMKTRNDAIRKLVDSSDGKVSKKYRLNKLDNPIYAERKQEELDKIANYSPEYQAAILTGAWITSSTHVYSIDHEKHCGRPFGYNPSWRHVAVADPATESKLGLTVWAQQPRHQHTQSGDGQWWCVIDQYVEGIFAPSLIVKRVEELIGGVNIVRRIYDSEAAWFARQAKETTGHNWIPVGNKSHRKQFFISQFTEALGVSIRIAEWCTRLLTELENCERNEQTDKIANSSKWHLIDTAHYFVDCMPPDEQVRTYFNHFDFLMQQDDERRLKEAKQARVEAMRKARLIASRRPTASRPARGTWTRR